MTLKSAHIATGLHIAIAVAVFGGGFVLGREVSHLSDEVADLSFEVERQLAFVPAGEAAAGPVITPDTSILLQKLSALTQQVSVLSTEIEELRSVGVSASAGGSPPPAAAPVREADPALLADINNSLFTMINTGNSSPGEIAALESRIARLPPKERTEALVQLNQAIMRRQIPASN